MNWTCPTCSHAQASTQPKSYTTYEHLHLGDHVLGSVGLTIRALACSNPDCLELVIDADLWPDRNHGGNFIATCTTPTQHWRLRPGSAAKPQPEHIPKAIRDDYREACLVKDLSAKASATLSRRCLQGMIRDFGQVKPSTLFIEINALSAGVDAGTAPRDVSADSIAALNAVRRIGNIGAHMEQDVNLVIDVEPDEAQVLIEVVELLLEDWYVERHKRTKKFAHLLAIDQEKARLRLGVTQPPAPTDADEVSAQRSTRSLPE